MRTGSRWRRRTDDENTLFVGGVGNGTIVKYTLAADGTVMTTSRSVLKYVTLGVPGLPD